MSSRIGRSFAAWPNRHPVAFAVGTLGTLAVLTAFVCAVIANNGTYPGGVDTLCHIYKGDVLYRSIEDGQWWPLYDPLWYNGVQMMRYWAPLPVYAFAGCEALAGGDPLSGFVVFCGAVFLLGALSWTYVGMKIERPWLGLFVGVLWFFLPNNLIALFYEGNLPRCICLVMLPVFVYVVNRYLEDGGWRRLPAVTALFAFMALCHSGYAGMVAIAMAVYLACYGATNRRWARGLTVFASMALGYAVIGIWLVPSLIGGITSTSSDQIMAGFFQSLAYTLNPFERFSSGNTKFYFGAAAAILAVLGVVCAKRKSLPGFWAAIIIVLCTSETMFPVLSKLPGGQYLWMLRFLSIALAFALFGFLTWRTLRTPLVILLCALLVVDAVPSWSLAYGNQDGSDPQERLQVDAQRMLVDEAKQITTQRLALVDESRFDSESAYVATGLGDPVAISEGAAWQSSVTASNFMQLDRALEQGEFDYLFDRSLELGDDSVIVLTSLVKERDDSTEADMDTAAARSGYALVDENGEYRLYHRDTPGSFGVKSDYRAIAIGSSAPVVALQFPVFQEGDSTVLDDYAFDDLKSYDVVFLGGFTYRDRDAAEDLVYRLADAGVRIVVAADGIPSDEHTGSKVFLGLDCEDITFSNGFPEMQTAAGPLITTLFPSGYQDWITVYVNGIVNPRAVIEEGSYTLPVYGTLDNENIVVIGLNLTYYESLTHDEGVAGLLADALGVSSDELPMREVVGLSVVYGQDGRDITVTSPKDGVNTTIAYQDIFASQSPLKRQNNLLVVDKGTTEIKMSYPYLWQGLAVSAAGLIACVAFFALVRTREKRRGRG